MKDGATIGFDTARYLAQQERAIMKALKRSSDRLYIEFGGKLIHDKHAARVLPGYDENTKVHLIKRLCRTGELIFVVSAQDIIRNRIRGDFKITYDAETIRVLDELSRRRLPVKAVALSLLARNEPIPKKVLQFARRLRRRGITTYFFYAFEDYLHKKFDVRAFEQNPFIQTTAPIVCIISPGGGSGKFGVCLSQLYHEMRRGVKPSYFKFETFPVHDLPLAHPLNLSFMAASADFYDAVMSDRRHQRATSYSRDIENYELLRRLSRLYAREGVHLRRISSATAMGVNMLSHGIVDDELVQKEAVAEIARRLVRYKFEVAVGLERKEVLARVRKILRML